MFGKLIFFASLLLCMQSQALSFICQGKDIVVNAKIIKKDKEFIGTLKLNASKFLPDWVGAEGYLSRVELSTAESRILNIEQSLILNSKIKKITLRTNKTAGYNTLSAALVINVDPENKNDFSSTIILVNESLVFGGISSLPSTLTTTLSLKCKIDSTSK
jgi:hypothetical protein